MKINAGLSIRDYRGRLIVRASDCSLISCCRIKEIGAINGAVWREGTDDKMVYGIMRNPEFYGSMIHEKPNDDCLYSCYYDGDNFYEKKYDLKLFSYNIFGDIIVFAGIKN